MVPARGHHERGHEPAGPGRSATLAGNRMSFIAYVTALQRSAGNQAVAAMLQTAPTSTPVPTQSPVPTQTPVPTLPSADDLTTRIAQSIGVWETNRGGTEPKPTESELDTVSGVHASYATIEQATMPYVVDVLARNKDLWAKATPALTKKEIEDATARVKAIEKLLDGVADEAKKMASAAATATATPTPAASPTPSAAASPSPSPAASPSPAQVASLLPSPAASPTPSVADTFLTNHKDLITPTGLGNDQVKTMFKALELKATVDAAHTEVTAKDSKKTAKQAAEAIPEDQRLKIGIASLSAYIDKPEKWGENRAAWERAAVEAMPGDLGTRIKTVVESDKGTALAIPTIKSRLDTELAKKPQPTEAEIVEAVGQKNNPGEDKYGENVWTTYQRLYPAATPSPTPAASPSPSPSVTPVQKQADPGIRIQRSHDKVPVQRSPSGDLDQAFGSGGKPAVLEKLRAMGSSGPIRADKSLTDWLEKHFDAGSDDRWLADQLINFGAEPRWPADAFNERATRAHDHKWPAERGNIKGSFDAGKGKGPVEAFFFPGSSDRRAMVIGGVHGTEGSGVEVVNDLLDNLRKPDAPTPFYSVIVVPVLFPENLKLGKRLTPGAPEDPNRNFPAVSQTLAQATAAGRGQPIDTERRPIEPENVILIDLIERFQPERIASVHGHSVPTKPAHGQDMPGIFVDPRNTSPEAKADDQALTLRMAKAAKAKGVRVPGNWVGDPAETSEYPPDAPKLSKGVSLGGYGPTAAGARPAMTTITVEVYGNVTSDKSTDGAARKKELESLAGVLQDLFLGPPAEVAAPPLLPEESLSGPPLKPWQHPYPR